MWDIDVIATQRQNDLLRRSARHRLARRARAAAAARRRADHESAYAGDRARRALGFALVHAGLWILVGGGRDVRDEQLEKLARDPELETARPSAPHRT